MTYKHLDGKRRETKDKVQQAARLRSAMDAEGDQKP